MKKKLAILIISSIFAYTITGTNKENKKMGKSDLTMRAFIEGIAGKKQGKRLPLSRSLTNELIDEAFWALDVAYEYGDMTEKEKEKLKTIFKTLKELSLSRK